LNNKKILKISGFIITALWLAGCQVQPLHSTAALSDGSSLSTTLASLEITDPKSRLDQLVRNELQFSLSGGTQPTGNSPYELSFITSKYVLKDRRKAVPIAQGTEKATASYDRVDQEFANVRSERDAEIRAAKATALRLRQAIAIALKKAR